jgi:hypothetical protein
MQNGSYTSHCILQNTAVHCGFENNYQALVASISKGIKIRKIKSCDCIQVEMFSQSIGPVHTKTTLTLYMTFLRSLRIHFENNRYQ